MLPHNRPQIEDDNRVTSIQGAADRLGVTERTIRRKIAAGELPAYRLGAKTIRIREADLMALLRPIPTVGDLNRAS